MKLVRWPPATAHTGAWPASTAAGPPRGCLLYVLNDGLRAGHGLGFGAANTGIQRRQLRRRTHTVDQFFQRCGRLGVKIGQRRDGGDFFVALGRRGAEHHIAHGNRTVVCRATEVDGVALHLHVDVVVVAQGLVNAADFDHSHPRDHDQQRQIKRKPRHTGELRRSYEKKTWRTPREKSWAKAG